MKNIQTAQFQLHYVIIKRIKTFLESIEINHRRDWNVYSVLHQRCLLIKQLQK